MQQMTSVKGERITLNLTSDFFAQLFLFLGKRQCAQSVHVYDLEKVSLPEVPTAALAQE